MSVLSRYWHIWCMSPTQEAVGYQHCCIPTAQTVAQRYLARISGGDVQPALLADFHAAHLTEVRTQAEAGLCLRCYASEAILKACRRIDYLFGSSTSFTYRDLLPFVLTDDGKTLVVLDRDRKTQLVIGTDESRQVSSYPLFSVDVLRTFQAEAPSRLSLDNWIILRTKRHPELKQFLAEFGFQHLSDWALLNRARSSQLESLSDRDRHLVTVFHQIYRRDRRQNAIGGKRCPDPTPEQLREMIGSLHTQGVTFLTAAEVLSDLKRAATQLRQYDIWSHRVPLDVYDPETGQDTLRSDLPTIQEDAADLEQQEFLTFFHDQLQFALCAALRQGLRDRKNTLERSKKYASFASQLIPGLQLYYEQGLSLKEIAPRLGMSSWDQTRRILNPGELLNKVRAFTVQQVLDRLLEQVQQKGLASNPPDPDYLRTLAEQVEAVADHEIFQAAVEEMRAGQHRSFTSVYAHHLRPLLHDFQNQSDASLIH